MARKVKQLRPLLTVARITLALELALFASAFLFALNAGRTAFVDRFRHYTGWLLLTISFMFFGLVHMVVTRRLVRVVERRFAPAEYDERRILFDLGQEARSATSLDSLYDSIVNKIRDALGAENVSIFVRDDETGDYVCRVSAPQFQRAYENGTSERPHLRIARDAFIITRLRHLATPLTIEPIEFETWQRAFEGAAPAMRAARERESDVLKRIKSTLLLQITIRDQLVGILSLGPRRARHKYSSKDKEMLMSVAGELAFVIENARLIERIVSEEQLRRELQLAAEVQQGLLPEELPPSEQLELSGFCRPARGVGGDYYDFLPLGNQQLGVAIADVAGKGISAALVMASVQAALRSQTMMQSAPQGQPQFELTDMMVAINRLLYGSTRQATYVTFFYGQFDEHTKRLTYVNAGHNPPMLYISGDDVQASRAPEDVSVEPQPLQDSPTRIRLIKEFTKRSWQMLETGGMVIGLFEPCLYEQETVQLESGDILVAYTDGVTEALNREGEEFGEHRLQDAIARTAHLSADQIREMLVRAVEEWCGSTPQHDDLTFLIMKVK
ncbi:MAG TPA: GAF domain-containing SpoIIE family protein phosphatase [Pyrinomonadaceae bacterium]|nr:GAF domain-containing SpoIIE family protein phosphatase [Pyrinomonadaceae bacterium]